MAKKKPNIVTIDFSIWGRQSEVAKLKRIKQTTLATHILRKQVESWYIKELGIVSSPKIRAIRD
jgi:hypothetical protein